MTTRVHDIQYKAIIFAPDANGGPGVPKMELTPDMLNVVWQQAMNSPGQMALTMVRFNEKLSNITRMVDHIALVREWSGGSKTVFAGKVVLASPGGSDVVLYAWDYMAFLQRSRTGYRVGYPKKLIGTEIVAPEWNLAKTVATSPFAFVTTGTIEDPLALDDVTPITTNDVFGVMDFDRLYTFYALAEMSMANTDHNVVFEITREAPHTFNFWKNRGTNKTNYHFSYPGNVVEYASQTGEHQIINDFATIISDPVEGHVEYVLDDGTSIATYRRLQDAVAIKTLYGLNSSAPEADQQKAALARMLQKSKSPPGLFSMLPRQGEFNPFDGCDLGDLFPVIIRKDDKSGDDVTGYHRWTGISGAWSPDAGELLQVMLR